MKPLLDFTRFTVCALCASVVLGQECRTSSASDKSTIPSSVSIYNQTDTDKKLGNCSTINGNLFINSDYVGTLNISTITNITGDIYVQASGLTSLNLDNLLYVDEIRTNNYGNFTSLSLLQLMKANEISASSKSPMSINAPALVTARRIQLTGNYSSLKFPRLENGNFTLNSVGAYDSSFKLLAISLPSLKTSFELKIYGNIESIDVPKLATSTGSIGITSYRPLNLSFPSLVNAGTFELSNVANLSVPRLQTVEDLEVSVFSPLKLSLPALIASNKIQISGNVTNVLLPVLTKCTTLLSIFSNLKVDCASAASAHSHILQHQKADGVQSTSTPHYTCEQRYVWDEDAFMRRHNLSMGLGFGLGIGIPLVIVVACLVWVFWKRWLWRREQDHAEWRRGGWDTDGMDAYLKEQKRIIKEREQAAKLAARLAEVNARRERREEELRRKIRFQRGESPDSDLTSFRLVAVRPAGLSVPVPARTPVVLSTPTPTPTPVPTVPLTGREEDGNPDDPPPQYEWEAVGGRSDAGAGSDVGEGSNSNSRWRDGGGQFTEEETELLKGRRSAR